MTRIAFALIAAILVPACGGGPAPVPVVDLEVCAKQDVDKLKAEGEVLLALAATGGIHAALAQALIDVVTEGAGIVGCAFSMVVQQYLAEPHTLAERKDAHDAMEEFRTKISPPGHLKTFVQPDGLRL